MPHGTPIYISRDSKALHIYPTRDSRDWHMYITNDWRDLHVYITSDSKATHVYVENPEKLPESSAVKLPTYSSTRSSSFSQPSLTRSQPIVKKKDRSWGCFSVTFAILGFAGGLFFLGSIFIGLFLPVGVESQFPGGGRWGSDSIKATGLLEIALLGVGCSGPALAIIVWKRGRKR